MSINISRTVFHSFRPPSLWSFSRDMIGSRRMGSALDIGCAIASITVMRAPSAGRVADVGEHVDMAVG